MRVAKEKAFMFRTLFNLFRLARFGECGEVLLSESEHSLLPVAGRSTVKLYLFLNKT